jgi:hypothetical protein
MLQLKEIASRKGLSISTLLRTILTDFVLKESPVRADKVASTNIRIPPGPPPD